MDTLRHSKINLCLQANGKRHQGSSARAKQARERARRNRKEQKKKRNGTKPRTRSSRLTTCSKKRDKHEVSKRNVGEVKERRMVMESRGEE